MNTPVCFADFASRSVCGPGIGCASCLALGSVQPRSMTFGQDNEMAALAARIANERFGSLKIGSRLSPLNEHLGHANSEFHNYHQASLLLIRSLGLS